MSIPLSGTDIRVLSGIPFHNDYKHTRWFDNKSQQESWFTSQTTLYADSSHSFKVQNQKDKKPNGTIAVRKEHDSLLTANYVMFRNNSKWFYAFVTSIEYVNKETTWIHFDLDVVQTWMFDITFKPSMVLREHTKLWNDDGTPVINTLNEGLDYGSMYTTVSVEPYKPHGSIYFLVIVCKERMDVNAKGDNEGVQPIINGAPQPLTFYIHPFKRDGSDVNITMMGETFKAPKVTEVLKNLYKIEKAMNNIVSLYVTEHFGDDILTTSNGVFFGNNYSPEQIQDDTDTIQLTYVKSLPEYKTTVSLIGNKYNGFSEFKESKLLMYPYCLTILDDFKGNRIEIRNEYIHGEELILLVRGALGTSQKTTYAVQNYNEGVTGYEANQISMEYALINNKPSDVPIITDLLSAYLQGNKNSIATQQDSIVFNGIMNGISSVMSSTSQMGGSVAGTVGAGANGIMNVVHGMGNSMLQLQAIDSKQKDIDNIPANITKQGSDTYYDSGYDYKGVYVIKKQIKQEYVQKLTHYFNMFGYKLNQVKVPNLKTRNRWNYVQTLDANIIGKLNDQDLRMIKNIFNSGITLWHIDDIGNYSLENGVR